MSSQLPLLPSIDHLRYQAKNLFELCRVGNNGAIEQLCSTFPEFRMLSIVDIAASVRLHHAQEVVAKQYGFQSWPKLCESVDVSRRAAWALCTAMEDPKMDDIDYRAGIARSKGLPAIGTSRVSEHGVRYDVVDYMPAISGEGVVRIRAGGAKAHINDLLPVIAFPEMSDRLYELYIETDCVTSKPLIFFDSMPGMHRSTAAPGLHQVFTVSGGMPLYFHFDAARLHETIIAHELGHVWVEKVEQIEDCRHPLDQSDYQRITQFYHIQSFVMDLCDNDMLERRGFDMSIIAAHEAESIHNLADNCARKAPMRNMRVLAGVINAIAGALLEMERFPAEWSSGIKTSLEMIEIGLPEAFEPAKGFVRSVLRHSYADSAAVMRVVDECAVLSFAAIGETFDPANDLHEVELSEPNWDKRPEFLSCLPRSCKNEVFRLAAEHGITARANYDVLIHGRENGSVTLTDPLGKLAEPVKLYFNLPYIPDPRLMPGAPMPDLPVGSSYIPHLGMPSHATSKSGSPGTGAFPGRNQPQGFGNNPAMMHGGFQPPAMPDPYEGLPAELRAQMKRHGPPDWAHNWHNGWNQPDAANEFGANFGVGPRGSVPAFDPFAEQAARTQRQYEEIDRMRAEERYRIQIQNERLMETHFESYSGTDLKPSLTPQAEEYAKLHPRQAIEATDSERNYMAGLGLWISRVGFEQQWEGELAYGYANNNPVMYIDPDGSSPQRQTGPAKGRTIGNNGTALCPNLAAGYDFLFQHIKNRPQCIAAINRVCPGGLAFEIGQVPFIVRSPCNTANAGSVSCTDTNYPPKPFPPQYGPGSTCGSNEICFDPILCNAPARNVAQHLLFEMMNWCNCKYHNNYSNNPKNSEQPAEDVTQICSEPGHSGLYPGKGGGNQKGNPR